MTHHFDTEVAKKYGMKEAVILENLYFWCSKNKANNHNFFDGNYWTYNSIKAFSEMFDYMTEKQIYAALKTLEDNGLIISGCYNTNKYDRTKWYALTEKGYSIYQKGKMEISKKEEDFPSKENDISSTGKILLTDNKPDNKQHIGETDIKKDTLSPQNEDYKNNYSVSNAIQAECFDEIRNCYEELHKVWVKEKLPLSNASQSYFTFSCRELKTALSYWSGKGFTSEELLGALNNYLEVVKLIRAGESWMENVGDFNFFAKHILDYVDGNFDLNKYKRSKAAINTGQKEVVDINKILAEMGEA